MVRTRHLVVAGALLILGGMGGIAAALLMRTESALSAMPAAVILSEPQDHYPVVVETYDADGRSAFIERIRDSYVPPVVQQEPEPGPLLPTASVLMPSLPEPLPIMITEEVVSTFTQGSTTISVGTTTTEFETTTEQSTGVAASSSNDRVGQ
jgi:hypothetical protein